MSIFNHFQHLTLSPDQTAALSSIELFLQSPAQIFMLKGYAGSGKTTILKGLVAHLNDIDKNFDLMAPTGRAAKVIREKTGQEAFTVHKSIYSFDDMVEVDKGDSFYYYFKISNNTDVTNKVFIVDEASMLSDAKNDGEFFRFGTGHLLTDLINYTRVAHENVNSKIIFVGDPCQLAPVGDNSSKAFDREYLIEKFNISIMESEMKEVKRQDGESGILKIAGKMRKSISSRFFNDFNLRTNNNDILNPTYENFLEVYQQASSPKIIIASKNKTCVDLNHQIREMRFGNGHLPIQKGDIVIMGGNNYKKGIFNGEFAVVSEPGLESESRTIALRGKDPVHLTWRSVELVFPDGESENKVVKGKILENFLNGDNYLKPEETQALYVDFVVRHRSLKPKTKEFKEAIIKDEYFNCILMKYGYSVTCHKAQGGEWENVFTVWDHENQKDFNCFKDPQLKRAKDNEAFFRWAYTAVTRASKKLYALNPPFFNSYSSMTFLDVPVITALKELTGNQNQEVEIEIDEVEVNQELTQFNLLDQPLPLQDHFIKVRHTVRKQFIEILGWERKNLEIFYHFTREGQTASVKTWVNKDLKFNGKYQKLPSFTNSEELYNNVTTLLSNLSTASLKRSSVEAVIAKMEFEFELEEKYPFTRNLFDDIELLLIGSNIQVINIEHQQFKERYTFKRNQECSVLDFEYNSKGFFGRVVPIAKGTNSNQLTAEINILLQSFKQEHYAS